jgi:hypothetical protein
LTNDTKSNNGSISTTEETRNSSVPAKKAVLGFWNRISNLLSPFIVIARRYKDEIKCHNK